MRALHKTRRSLTDCAPVVDINTTPLIDVMLVLLIMLIITIPIQLHAVNLNLPTGQPPAQEHPPEVLRISIDAGGTVLWNGVALADHDELERRMADAALQTEPPELHLRPDRHARYDVVAAVLAAAKRLGLTRVGIVGAEQFAP